MNELTIFYDGGCPLCVSEMRHLYRLDSKQKIVLQDIHAEGLLSASPILTLCAPIRCFMGSWPVVK